MQAPLAARVGKAAVAAILALNLALLAYFIAFGYRTYFHSDAATASLLAQEIFESGRFFPPDWNYVNGDLMVLFGDLLILPLLPFVRNGFALHEFASFVQAGLILVATWLVAGLFTRERWIRLAALAIVASGASEVAVDSLFGQVSYGNVFFLAAFCLALAWRALGERGGRGRTAAIIVLAALTVLLYWSNPQRAIASCGLPLLCAIALHAGWHAWRGGRDALRRGMQLVVVLVAAIALGAMLHALTLRAVHDTTGAGFARWLDFAGMQANAFHAVHGMLAVLGCLPAADRPVVGVVGLWEAMRLLGGVAAVIALPVAIGWSLRSARTDGVRFLGMFTLVSFAIALFLQITTTIPDMTDPVTSARYLIPSLVFASLLVLAMAADARTPWLPRLVAGIVVAVLATGALAPSSPMSDPFKARRPAPREEVLAALAREGLHYGYATYWEAGVYTVLGAHDVRVRQVVTSHGMPLPMRHLSSNRWYAPEAWNGPTFLMLTDAEAAQVDWAVVASYAGPPQRTFRTAAFIVRVYPRNIAAVLPNWQQDMRRPVTLLPDISSLHSTGTFDLPTRTLVAEAGQAGALHFGPYMEMRPGRYRVTFVITCDAPAGGHCGTVDVVDQAGTQTLGQADIPAGTRRPTALVLDVARQGRDTEFRVMVSGAGRVALHAITIETLR